VRGKADRHRHQYNLAALLGCTIGRHPA
jgi:hypothetical protein